jgi:hypothetical protein
VRPVSSARKSAVSAPRCCGGRGTLTTLTSQARQRCDARGVYTTGIFGMDARSIKIYI